MRRTIYIPIALLFAAVGIVAIVHAQAWGAWSANPPQPTAGSLPSRLTTMQGGPPSMANEPQRLHPQSAVQLPSRFAAAGPQVVPSGAATAPDWSPRG